MEHTLPAELVTATAAAVAVTGLQDGRLYNGPGAARWEQLERSLWDLLSVRTNPDGTPRSPLLHVQKLNRDHGYAAKKVRTSVNVRGILKANWLHKHKAVLPALLVMFFPIDSHDPDWRERDSVMINEIQDRKRLLLDRGVKVIVVLVSVSDRDDPKVTQDRVTQVKNTCGLDVRTSLFVCAANANLRDFVLGLERTIFDQVTTYYREQAKRVKNIKDKLPKGTQLELHVRYNFKIAMYADLRQEPKSVIKYFNAAYNTLLELIPHARTPLRLIEIKVVAEYINYKLCKTHMHITPKDAVEQFQRHVGIFTPLRGPETMLHEHWFYIAKQYRSFGELLETAIKVNTVGVDQLQHPGYYYQIAATYTSQRKLTQGAMGGTLDAQTFARYETSEREFVGQPPKQRTHPLEEMDQAAGIMGLPRLPEDEWSTYVAFSCTYESRMEHSKLIIELLSRAYEQFKKYKNTRMTLATAAQIAREYYDTRNYEMALKFFERIAKTYRKEGWTAVLADILTLSLRCAVELKKFESVIEFSLELMSADLGMPVEYREHVQTELLKLIHSSESPPVVIDMEHACTVMHVKTQFPDTAQIASRNTPFRLLLRLNSALALRLSSIKVTFSAPMQPVVIQDNASSAPFLGDGLDLIHMSSEPVATDGLGEAQFLANLYLCPNKIYVLQLHVNTTMCREVQCAAVVATVGTTDHATSLLFRIADRPTPAISNMRESPWSRVETQTDGAHLDDVIEISTIRVLPRKPQVVLSMTHQTAMPVLLDEWFPLKFVVTNNESNPIEHISLSVEAKTIPGSEPRAYFAQDSSDLPQGKLALSDMSLPAAQLMPGGTATWPLHVRCPRAPGDRVIVVSLRYRDVSGADTDEIVTLEEILPVVKAFHIAFAISPQQSILYAHQPLLENSTWLSPSRSDLSFLSIALRIASAWSLRVASAAFVPMSGAELEKRGVAIQLVSSGIEHEHEPTVWHPNQVHTSVFRLKTAIKATAPEGLLPIGFLQIKWRRALESEHDNAGGIIDDGGAAFYTVTKLQIFSPERPKVPFNVVAGELAPILFTLRNEGNKTEEVTVVIEAADGFLLSGFKQRQMRLLPYTAHPLAFNVFPKESGSLALPIVKLMSHAKGAPTTGADTVLYQMGPFMTFVEPAKTLGH